MISLRERPFGVCTRPGSRADEPHLPAITEALPLYPRQRTDPRDSLAIGAYATFKVTRCIHASVSNGPPLACGALRCKPKVRRLLASSILAAHITRAAVAGTEPPAQGQPNGARCRLETGLASAALRRYPGCCHRRQVATARRARRRRRSPRRRHDGRAPRGQVGRPR